MWYGVAALIIVMVLMYLFILGANRDEQVFDGDADVMVWRCTRCSIELAFGDDYSCKRSPCPMELVTKDKER